MKDVASGLHKRTGGITATIQAGFEIFTRFAEEVGGVETKEAERLRGEHAHGIAFVPALAAPSRQSIKVANIVTVFAFTFT